MTCLPWSTGLRDTDFIKLADHGFGDGINAYAHTMAWFENRLYVGTTRANLCLIRVNNPDRLRFWPIKCPDDVYDLDLRAQIWRYDPRTRNWQRVFISPLVPGTGGRQVPRDLGYRGMAVFKGRTDQQAALYITNWASARAGKTPVIIRSRGDSAFTPVSQLGQDPTIHSYRTLVPMDGRLYTSPTGRTRGKANVVEIPVVLGTADPASEPWRLCSPPGFGDATNVTIFEMVAFNDHLYAGTVNPFRGFQIWKARPDSGISPRWVRVIADGAYRGNLNEGACSMCVFNNALYIGTGIQGGGYDKTYRVGPAAAELLRIHPDDSWDLIVGEPRATPHGSKVPLSGFGPGFNEFLNGYVWRMAVHDGWLYAGTYNWSAFLPYLRFDHQPPWLQTFLTRVGINRAVNNRGGFHLWRSCDGTHWTPVTTNGFGNIYNCGARTMVSTPYGLFVGTANLFGPEVAIETVSGWRYVPNQLGGLEIWLGTSGHRRD